MNAAPINFRAGPARRIFCGNQTAECRLAGDATTRRMAVGHYLWVREPFRLDKALDGMPPRDAMRAERTPRVSFCADLDFDDSIELGKERMARTMPKALSRMTLRILSIDRLPIARLSRDDIRDLGFSKRTLFEGEWDEMRRRAMQFGARRQLSLASENPEVALIRFRLIDRNIERLEAAIGRAAAVMHQVEPA